MSLLQTGYCYCYLSLIEVFVLATCLLNICSHGGISLPQAPMSSVRPLFTVPPLPRPPTSRPCILDLLLFDMPETFILSKSSTATLSKAVIIESMLLWNWQPRTLPPPRPSLSAPPLRSGFGSSLESPKR